MSDKYAQEYLAITQQIEDASTRRWQAIALVVGGALAAAGWVIAAFNDGYSKAELVATSILGVPIIAILCYFRLDFQKRFKWRNRIQHIRMKQLERVLDFHIDTDIGLLDELAKTLGLQKNRLTRRWRKKKQQGVDDLKICLRSIEALEVGERQRLERLLSSLLEKAERDERLKADEEAAIKCTLSKIRRPEALGKQDMDVLRRLYKKAGYGAGFEHQFISRLSVLILLIWLAIIVAAYTSYFF